MSCAPERPAPRLIRGGGAVRAWRGGRPGWTPTLVAARAGRLIRGVPGRLPPRLRLAGTFALPALIVLAVVAVGFTALESRQLDRDFSQQLTIAADNIGNHVAVGLDRAGRYEVVFPKLDVVAASDHAAVRIIGGDRLAVLASTLDAPPLGPPRIAPVDIGPYRVVTRPGHANIGSVYVQYARPIAALDGTVRRLAIYAILGVVVGTFLAGAAGARIARRVAP